MTQADWGEISKVASGEKSLKVAVEPKQLASMGAVIFISMFLATLMALLVAKKVTG